MSKLLKGLILTIPFWPIAASADNKMNWTGFHAGLNVGYGWDNDDGGQYPAPSSPSLGGLGGQGAVLSSTTNNATPGISASGFMGGLQFGFNRQFGQFVLGLETDFQGTGINGSYAHNLNTGSVLRGLGGMVPVVPPNTANLNLDFLGTGRGVLGILATDAVLVYATGGVAYGQVSTSTVFHSPSGVFSATGNGVDTLAGWVAGGGLEYALNNRFSAKLEGLYYDLGHQLTVGNLQSQQLGKYFEVNGPIVRVGFNYHF